MITVSLLFCSLLVVLLVKPSPRCYHRPFATAKRFAPAPFHILLSPSVCWCLVRVHYLYHSSSVSLQCTRICFLIPSSVCPLLLSPGDMLENARGTHVSAVCWIEISECGIRIRSREDILKLHHVINNEGVRVWARLNNRMIKRKQVPMINNR